MHPTPSQPLYIHTPTQSPLHNPLSGQQLANHEMAHVLISPIGKVAGDTGNEGDVEDAPIGEAFILAACPTRKRGKG